MVARADDPLNLAVARVVVFAVIGWRFAIDPLVAVAQLPPDLVRVPIGIGWAQSFIPTDPDSVRLLGLVVRLSAAAAAFGLLTRVSAWVATVSACLLFVIPNMYGHVGHDRHHLIWFGAVLAASPCGDRLSLDRLIQTLRSGPQPLPGPDVRYGFPLSVMLVTMGVAYFWAGFWKLAIVGPAWFASDSLSHLAAKLSYAGIGGRAGPLLAHPLLMRALGFGTIAFELGFLLLVVLNRRAIALVAACVFHVGTYLALGISFGHLLYCYLGLLDWAGLRRRLGTNPIASTPAPSSGMPSALQLSVAIVAIGGNLVFGVLRIGNGWPLACYPRFDVLHTALVTSYVVTGVAADGHRVRLHDAQLGGPQLGRHFYNLFRANQARAGGLESVEGRLQRWQQLCSFVWATHPQLRDAGDVRFLLDDLDLSSGPDEPRRLGERALFACQRR
jgi:hypothetical protein